MQPTRTLKATLVFFLAVLALAACQSGAGQLAGCPDVPGICVPITDDDCPSIAVQAGGQVTWLNQGKEGHPIAIASSDGKQKFGTDLLTPGSTVSFTFPDPGEYTVACSPASTPSGVITVNP